MLAKKLTMKEANDYEVQNIDMRIQYCEKMVNANSATCYSIDKSSFNPQNMVQIRMVSSENHGIDFTQKTYNPYITMKDAKAG